MCEGTPICRRKRKIDLKVGGGTHFKYGPYKMRFNLPPTAVFPTFSSRRSIWRPSSSPIPDRSVAFLETLRTTSSTAGAEKWLVDYANAADCGKQRRTITGTGHLVGAAPGAAGHRLWIPATAVSVVCLCAEFRPLCWRSEFREAYPQASPTQKWPQAGLDRPRPNVSRSQLFSALPALFLLPKRQSWIPGITDLISPHFIGSVLANLPERLAFVVIGVSIAVP